MNNIHGYEKKQWGTVSCLLATFFSVACGGPVEEDAGYPLAEKTSALQLLAARTYVANATVMNVANYGNFDASKGRLLWEDDAAHGRLGGRQLPTATRPRSASWSVDNSISGSGSTAGVRCLGGAAGDWCGSESNVVGGLSNVLYHCAPGATATNARVCTASCQINPGHNDTCSAVTVSENITTSSDYQCAAFAQTASGAPGTSTWSPGAHVLDHCPVSGTVIATFATGKYGTGDHTAILVGCSGTSLDVFDSNFVDYSCTGGGSSCTDHVARHRLDNSGSGPSNSGNYYVVQVP